MSVAGSSEPTYHLAEARSAARDIADQLPESVTPAVIEFVTGELRRHPRQRR
jgi:hypothetical protein